MKADFLTKQSDLQRFVFQHLTDAWSQMGQTPYQMVKKPFFHWHVFTGIKKDAQFVKTGVLHHMACGMFFTHSQSSPVSLME